MHSESYEVSKDATDKINKANRKISIGTTVTRVLEHVSQNTNGTLNLGQAKPIFLSIQDMNLDVSMHF